MNYAVLLLTVDRKSGVRLPVMPLAAHLSLPEARRILASMRLDIPDHDYGVYVRSGDGWMPVA